MRMHLVALVSLVSFVIGCGSGGPQPVPVSGKVLYKGEPVQDAIVTFHSTSGGRSASGRTDAEGNFTLTTNKTGDGAVPGDYVVTISKPSASYNQDELGSGEDGEYDGELYGQLMDAAARGENVDSLFEDTLPPKYSNPAESGLKRTVTKEGPNEFEFNLE